MVWSTIVFTCRNGCEASAYREEVDALRRKGVFDAATDLLVVEDPVVDFGSGGSTLNALLVVAESLSARAGFTVLQPDILERSRVLIFHLGRPCAFEPCGSAFYSLPATWLSPIGCRVRVTPLLQTYRIVTERLTAAAPSAGVWLCGGDSVLFLPPDWSPPSRPVDAATRVTAFSVPTQPADALSHGVYRVDGSSTARDLVYRGGADQLDAMAVDGRVQLVTSLLFLPPTVVNALLALNAAWPMHAPTYLGVDSGGRAFKSSFFFDFLLPTCRDVAEADFVGGRRAGFGGGGGGGNGDAPCGERRHCESQLQLCADALPRFRQLLWRAMRPFSTNVVSLNGAAYHYFENRPSNLAAFLDTVSDHIRMCTDYEIVDSDLVENGGVCAFAASGITAEHEGCTFDLAIHVKDETELRRVTCRGVELATVVDTASVSAAKHFSLKREEELRRSLSEMRRVLLNNRHVCLLPAFKTACRDGHSRQLLDALHDVASECADDRVLGRALSSIADVLGELAEGRGGLRSGPAANHDFAPAFDLLHVRRRRRRPANEPGAAQAGRTREGVAALRCVADRWMDRRSAVDLVRAARHYEAAAQIFIRKTVLAVERLVAVRAASAACEGGGGPLHVAEAAARVDVAGGWSDTPPITYEFGGAVLNIAVMIDGKKTVGASARAVETCGVCVESGTGKAPVSKTDATVCFDSVADIVVASQNPMASGALACAVLVCAGLVDVHSAADLASQLQSALGSRGLRLRLWSTLPHGSGLGTSSILAGCLMAVVWKAMARDWDDDSLLHAVLCVEQVLTTGGGWQDQVGGLTAAVKIGRFGSTAATARIAVEPLPTPPAVVAALERRLLLVYTGRTRLAKNLLQEVVRNWFSRKADIVHTVRRLVENAELCAEAVKSQDWSAFGKCAREYWEQKKFMAPGCEPSQVRLALHALYAAELIEAGGGGFMYLFLTATADKNDVIATCKQHLNSADVTFHTIEVDFEPLIQYTEP